MITILNSTIEVLEMLLVLDLSILLLLYVALWSLSLLAVSRLKSEMICQLAWLYKFFHPSVYAINRLIQLIVP
jgi:hypothetical protein